MIKHTIVLTKQRYDRSEVKHMLNDLKSIYQLEYDILYATEKTNSTKSRTKKKGL